MGPETDNAEHWQDDGTQTRGHHKCFLKHMYTISGTFDQIMSEPRSSVLGTLAICMADLAGLGNRQLLEIRDTTTQASRIGT